MKSRICGSFLLIFLAAFTTADTEFNIPEKVQEVQSSDQNPIVEVPIAEILVEKTEADKPKGETAEVDYESALRPATLHKRSISNIIKLLLGGNVPPNHPLVKESEPKSWSLAGNILAALPSRSIGGHLVGSAAGWGAPSAAEQLAHLFATKAKILPYTGQVASGLTGIAAVKGDILKQIHSLSTQVIAQAAAEAAAKAVAKAAAAHAVTSQVSNAINHAPQAVFHVNQAVSSAKAQALKPLINSVSALAGHAGHAGHVGAVGAVGGGYADYGALQGWHSTQQNSYVSPNTGKTPGEQPGPPYYPAAAATSPVQQQYEAPVAASKGIGQAVGQQYQNDASASYQPQQYQNNQYNLYSPYLNPNSRQSYNEYSTLGGQNFGQSQRSGPMLTLPGGTQLQGYNPLPLTTNPNALTNLSLAEDRTVDLQPLNYFLSAVSADESGRNVKEPPSILSSLATLITASTSAYNTINAYADPATRAAAAAAIASGSNLQSVSESNPKPIYSQFQSGTTIPLDQRTYASQNSIYSQSQSGIHTSQRPVYSDPFRVPTSSSNLQQPQYQSGQQAYSTPYNPSSNSFSSQPFSNNAGQYSPHAQRNSQYANSISGTPLGGYRNAGSGYPGNNGGTGSSSGYAGGFGSQSAGSSPFQTTRSPGYSGNRYTSQSSGNFISPSGAYSSTAGSSSRPSNFPVYGQANYPTSQNTYSPIYSSTQQSARGSYNGASQINGPSRVGGQANGFSGNGNSYLNHPIQDTQYQSSSSEQIPKFELPPMGGHSQYNHNKELGNNQRSIKKTKKGLIPNPISTNSITNPLIINTVIDNENIGHNDHPDDEKNRLMTVNFNHQDDEAPISFEQYDEMIIAKVPEHKKKLSADHENRWTDYPDGQRPNKLHSNNPHQWASDISSRSENKQNSKEVHRKPSTFTGERRSDSKSRAGPGESKTQSTFRQDGQLPRPISAKLSISDTAPTVYSTLPKYLFGEDERRGELLSGTGNTYRSGDTHRDGGHPSQTGKKILGTTSRRGEDKITLRISKAIDESSKVLIHDHNPSDD